MAFVTYIEHDGTEHKIEAEEGDNVMEVAVEHSIPGIDADCGGSCACATCHVYVDEALMERVGGRSDIEQTMLANTENVRPNSRLSCQLTVFDGLRVTMPSQQF